MDAERRFRHYLLRAALVTVLAITEHAFTRAGEVPEGFIIETLATNLNAATALAVAPDGRIFIADQTGPLRVCKNGRLLLTPALDLSGRVDGYWERGLIGVRLHPDFPHTPHVFILYVAKQPFPHHVLSRFTMLGDRADPGSEFVLLKGDDQRTLGGNVPHGHQGGPICFGADGKLYLTFGEQTAGEPAQSLATLQGKILRLNPDGSIPQNNPFFTRTTGKYRAIWAYGVRNSFGLAMQRETGRMFFTDVGGSAFEEVNELVRGANYGWPHAEGFSTNPAFKNPLHAYPPALGRSVVGAAFYPRTAGAEASQPPSIMKRQETAFPDKSAGGWKAAFPEKWRGKFFFADWAANWIKALDPDGPSNVVTFAKGFDAPATLEVTPDGSLLVLNRGTLWREGKKFAPNSGSLMRIRFTGSTPVLTRQPLRPPLPRTLAASGLFDALTRLHPRPGFVEFQIIAQPWQPGVTMRRWISLPPKTALRINAEGEFEFPPGAILVGQHFVKGTARPFETHVWWFDLASGPSRLAQAAAYRWSADGPDAALVEDGEVIPLPGDPAHRWFSPGVEEMLNLDTIAVSFLLPLSPRQLSRDHLANWNTRGWLDPTLSAKQIEAVPRLAALDNPRAPMELRVRSYLDVNCAACHRPGGPSRGNFDARFSTPLAQQKILNGDLTAGDLGIVGARVIVPGHPEKSILLQRLSRNDHLRMPPVAVNDELPPVIIILREWIQQLPSL